MAQIRKTAILITPTGAVTASDDEPDNRFLECAQAAKAHYLITGNTRHFPERWKYTKIVTAGAFIDLWKVLRGTDGRQSR